MAAGAVRIDIIAISVSKSASIENCASHQKKRGDMGRVMILNKPKSGTTGHFVTEEDGTRYFVHGNTRIKAVEHFAPKGKTFQEIMLELIRKKAEQEGLA